MGQHFHGTAKAAVEDISIPVLLRATADNTEKTGVAYGDVSAYYWRQGGSATQIGVTNLSSLTDVHQNGGWYEVDSTNMPGLYRFDIPDAAFAIPANSTVGDWVVVCIKVANCYTFQREYLLESGGANEAYTLLTDASYGLAQLVRSTTPANTLTVDSSNNARADVRLWGGSAPSALTSGLVQGQANQLGTQAKTDVSTEVAAELDEAISELGSGAPSATPSIRTALAALYMAMRNKKVNDGSYLYICNSAGEIVWKQQISEASGTATRYAVSAP